MITNLNFLVFTELLVLQSLHSLKHAETCFTILKSTKGFMSGK